MLEKEVQFSTAGYSLNQQGKRRKTTLQKPVLESAEKGG
jgi:hypothetical protein